VKNYNIETDDFKFSENDCILPGEPLPLDVSRGCIFACRFCQYPHIGKKKLDYIRGMSYIEEELLYNYEKFGTTRYYILDDTFNDTEYKMKEFYTMTQRLPFEITFTAYARADLIQRFPDTAYMLQESGASGMFFGIESLHPDASKIVGKGWSGQHAKQFVPSVYHDIWKKQILVHTNFIVGLPKEPLSSIQSTVDWYIQNDLHSIEFAMLTINGPDINSSKYTIESEFDKNYQKYGFEFYYSTKHKKMLWKNDCWDAYDAYHATKDFSEQVKPYRRTHAWLSQGMMWAGHSIQDLRNKKLIDLPTSVCDNFSVSAYKNYYNCIMQQ
jgi:radical SAM superfamily enzyme YgiQ (UPF0313 family)